MRAAGINLPILSGTAMDGTYWLNSTPGLKDFYLPVQALDRKTTRARPSTRSRPPMTKKYGKPPTTQYAYPIYAFLDLWAKAVTEAGTTERKRGGRNQQGRQGATVLGPRTFTPKLHVQIACRCSSSPTRTTRRRR